LLKRLSKEAGMRNLLKSMMSFSWALPLFGVRQMSNLIGRPEAAAMAFDSVTHAAQSEMDEATTAIFKAGLDLQQRVMSGTQMETPDETFTTGAKAVASALPAVGYRGQNFNRQAVDLAEQTIVRMSCGSGTVRHGVDRRAYFIVHGRLEDLDGTADGTFEAAWAAKAFNLQDLVSYPNRPLAPFDRPFKPGEQGWDPSLNFTKAKWTFGRDRGWLEAVGPALSRIEIQSSGQTQFWYSVAAFVTAGGGSYDKVLGEATSLGSAHFSVPPSQLEALSFELNAVHVLKVMRQR
jgi:hypothetical protein